MGTYLPRFASHRFSVAIVWSNTWTHGHQKHSNRQKLYDSWNRMTSTEPVAEAETQIFLC